MAVDAEFEREDVIHKQGYERFIGMMRWGAILCAIIALIVIFVIAK